MISLNLSVWSAGPSQIFPVSVKDQISSSDGVIVGRFQGSSFAKSNDGEVITVGNFYIEQVAGISAKEILNRYSFRVQFPGGYWQGVKYKSKLAPSFVPGEKVVLILKKGKFGYELPYHALSKFNFEKRDGELFLYSKFYGEKKGVGHISWNNFNQLVEGGFGMRVGSYFNQRNYVQGQPILRKARSPASMNRGQPSEENYKIEIYWLVLILGVLGGAFSLFGRYQEDLEIKEEKF